MSGHVEWNTNLIDEVEQRLWQQVIGLAVEVANIAYNYAPKRTGDLAHSIRFEADKANFAITWFVDVPYGMFVEYGTRHMAARPYLRPALNTVGPQYGFDFGFAFNTPEIHAPLIAHKAGFFVPKTLTDKQRRHVREKLVPTSQRHHISNVSRARVHARRPW